MTEVRRYSLVGEYEPTMMQQDEGEYVLATDYDALAARVQELERLTLANEMLKGCLAEEGRRLAAMRAERDVMSNSREALVEVVRELRQQLAEAQGRVLEVGELNVKLRDAEQQVVRLREIITCLVKSADPNWYSVRNGYDWKDSVEQAETILRETGA